MAAALFAYALAIPFPSEADVPFQPPPQNRLIERVRSRIHEIAGLTSYDYRSVIVPVYTKLSSSVLRGTATFRIPFNQEFRVQSIRPHVAFVAPSSETMADGGSFAMTAGDNVLDFGGIDDRLLAKAHNCRVDIKIVSGRQVLFAQKGLPLSDLWPQGHGSAHFLDTPLLLPAGTTIELSASLQDSGAAGSQSEYGIVFSGAYVRNT